MLGGAHVFLHKITTPVDHQTSTRETASIQKRLWTALSPIRATIDDNEIPFSSVRALLAAAIARRTNRFDSQGLEVEVRAGFGRRIDGTWIDGKTNDKGVGYSLRIQSGK